MAQDVAQFDTGDGGQRASGAGKVSRRAVLRGGAAMGVVGLAAGANMPRAGAAVSTGPGIRLAEGGRTAYQIYVGSGEDIVVRQAATEFASYLGSITSAKFDVVSALRPPSNPYLIVVGRNNPVAAGVRSIDYDSLADDGFALRTIAKSVLIAGAGSRGTLYGAYWVLDRLCGVRWLSATYTYVPHTADLSLPVDELNGDQVPRFRYRQIYAGDANDPAYRQHNLLNGPNGQYEDIPTPAGIDTWSSYWPTESFGGTFHTLVPDQTLWYGGQLLCMDPRTREVAAANLIEVINKRVAAGEDPSYGFVQQDAGWTPDPDSQAFADAHGGALSAPVTDMVNDVLARVREHIPDARLSSQAYQFDFTPPTGIRPSDGVVMTVAPIQANFAQSLFAGDNKDLGTDIATWSNLSDDVLLWDYLTTFANYILPFPDWWAAGEGIQTFARQPGAQGYFGEAAYNTAAGAEFANLRIWVISRLLWNPGQNPDALIRQFCHGYYGQAGNYIYRYMQVMYKSVLDTSTTLTESVTEGAQYFTFDAMREADALFDQAEAAVAGDQTLLGHIRTLRLGVDYVILVRTPQFKRDAAAEGVDWDPDTANRLDRFTSELKASGLTQYNEAGGTPQELILKATIATIAATPPAAAAGLPASDWVDYQEDSLRLYAPVTTIIKDASASNQYTVRMPGSAPDWGVQVPLTQLPQDGTWKIYMSVRADTGTASPTSTAIQGGVYPPFGNLINVPVQQLSDGEYHEIALPGTYQNDATHYVYIAPPASPDIANVYVDRVFAVKQ